MINGTPLLCIGMPVRNGEAYLPEALDSILGQGFSDFEVVISDNGSTDATTDICRTYADRDRRVRYTRVDRNVGAAPNFNRVFGFCNSRYFKWATHDDLLAPDFLARCVALLEAEPAAVLAHSAVQMVDDAGRPLVIRDDGKVLAAPGQALMRVEPLHLAEGQRAELRFRDVLRRMNWCTAALGVIRAAALRRTHLHGAFYGGDYVLLGELALLGPFRQVEEALYLKRCHGAISVHLSHAERHRMVAPATPAGWPGLRLRRAYVEALEVADLSLGQRLSCYGTIARVAARNPVLSRILPRGLRSLPVVGGLLARDG